jgi:hypothetical protein
MPMFVNLLYDVKAFMLLLIPTGFVFFKQNHWV